MIIRLTRGCGERSGTLTCKRADGSCTWQKSSEYFALHDLIHYAVETTLGYTEAFYGLVAQGKGLEEFGTRNGNKDTYTLEESWAEGIVGALQWPVVGGGPAPTEEELIALIAQQFLDQGRPVPPLTVPQISEIRARIADLHARWHRLTAGATLELPFE